MDGMNKMDTEQSLIGLAGQQAAGASLEGAQALTSRDQGQQGGRAVYWVHTVHSYPEEMGTGSTKPSGKTAPIFLRFYKTPDHNGNQP